MRVLPYPRMQMGNGEQLGQGGCFRQLSDRKVYYEEHGAGPTVLMLHGGMATLESWFAMIPPLSEHHRLLCPERRGHGRTPDLANAITYEDMAQETIEFCDALGIKNVPVVGWSDGGILGLMVAAERPDLVERLAVIGTNCDVSGYTHAFAEEARQMTADNCDPLMREIWQQASGNPGAWPQFFEKMKALWLSDWSVPFERLKRIRQKTLVLCGDRDVVTLEHAGRMFEALPDGQLCVLPGCTHYAPVEDPEPVNAAILRFLKS